MDLEALACATLREPAEEVLIKEREEMLQGVLMVLLCGSLLAAVCWAENCRWREGVCVWHKEG